MYLEHFHLKESPFISKADSVIFFPGGNRGNILEKFMLAIEEDKKFIRLIGDEGIGKTLCCKIIEGRLDDTYEIVYIADPIGSFSDLIRIVVEGLGFQLAEEVSRQESMDALNDALDKKKKEGKKILLFIDEAEKLFLATLERMVRMTCGLDNEIPLQVLFVGRPELDANLDQLSYYCSSVEISKGLALQPLNIDETRYYLEFSLQAVVEDSSAPETLFSEEVTLIIFERTKGIIGKINEIAEEALEKACSAGASQVLAEHLPSSILPNRRRRVGAVPRLITGFDTSLFKDHRRLIGMIGVLVVSLVFVAFLLPGDDEKEVPLKREAISQSNLPYSVPKTVPLEEKNSRKSVEQPESPAVKVVLAESSKKPWPAESKETANKVQVQTRLTNSAIYNTRLRASASWLAGAYRGGYTIQLMMLSSNTAEQNARNLFDDEQMRAVKDHIYILRKRTSPSGVFLFYGNYGSLDDARSGRNQLPLFLRKHHPYALSISEAIKKLED